MITRTNDPEFHEKWERLQGALGRVLAGATTEGQDETFFAAVRAAEAALNDIKNMLPTMGPTRAHLA